MADNQDSTRKKWHRSVFDYWFARHSSFQRLRYGFILDDGTETACFTEKGFYAEPPLDDTAYYFCFPFMNTMRYF